MAKGPERGVEVHVHHHYEGGARPSDRDEHAEFRNKNEDTRPRNRDEDKPDRSLP